MIREVCTESKEEEAGQLVLNPACALQSNNQKQALAADEEFAGKVYVADAAQCSPGVRVSLKSVSPSFILLFSALVATEIPIQ